MASLRLRGLSCSYISGGQEEDAEGVKKGDYRLVFFTPEMLLERRRWRNMLKGEVYTTRLRTIAVDEAHTVKKWYDLYLCIILFITFSPNSACRFSPTHRHICR